MDNTQVKVFVIAGAKKEKIVAIQDDLFQIEVKEKAQGNMANKRVRELLAGYFHVSVGAVRIVKGHHTPKKIVIVRTPSS